MQKKLRKGMKRFCSMLLAAALVMTSSLPVSAAGEKKTPDRTAYGLQVGDILQPGEELGYEEWQQVQTISYTDYVPDGKYEYETCLMGNEMFRRLKKSVITIGDYERKNSGLPHDTGDRDSGLTLKKEEFGGWQVMEKNVDGASYGDAYLCLMAVPKDVVKSVTCKAKVSAGKIPETSDGQTMSQLQTISVPAGAGVTFYGFDAKDGKPLAGSGTSELTASPGDIVYAVTSPVQGYVSGMNIKSGNETALLEKCNLVYWEKTQNYWESPTPWVHRKNRNNPFNYTVPYERIVQVTGDMTFLPADADAVTAFVVPHTGVSVEATYIQANYHFQINYGVSKGNGDLGGPYNYVDVVLNQKIELWNPSKNETVTEYNPSGTDIIAWMAYLCPIGTEYYEKGEEYIADGNIENFSSLCKTVNDTKITVSENNVKIWNTIYSNNVRGLRAPLIETDGVMYPGYYHMDNKYLSVNFKVNPEEVPDGMSLMRLSTNCPTDDYPNPCFDYDPEVYYSSYPSKVIAGESAISAEYAKGRYDQVVDLTNRYAAFGGQSAAVLPGGPTAMGAEASVRDIGSDGADYDNLWYEFLYNYLCKSHDLTLNRTMVMNQELFEFEGDYEGVVSDIKVTAPYSVMIDLNGDKEYDVMATKAYMGDVQFDRLYGALDCEEPSYDIIVNEAGYGKFTIKLYDTCTIEYISEGEVVHKQVVKKTLPIPEDPKLPKLKRDGYTFKGWSSSPNSMKAFDFNSIVNGDMKLYAIWEKNPEKEKEPEPYDDLTNPHSSDSEKDIKGSKFGHLFARVQKATKNSITLTWKKLPDAAGYIIFGSQCNNNGKKYKFQYLATVDASKGTWTQKKLKKDKYYKYYVLAFKEVNGKREKICISKTIHATTVSPKYGAAQKIKLNKKKVTLKKGKKFRLVAKEINTSKTIQHHRGIGYESSDESVAKVDENGRIKAVGKGKCKIWAFAQNGKYATLKVTVK